VDATEAQEGIEDAVKDARTRKLALLIAALAHRTELAPVTTVLGLASATAAPAVGTNPSSAIGTPSGSCPTVNSAPRS